MNISKQKSTKKKRAPKGSGRLFKRAKVNGEYKELPPTSKVPGSFYLEYIPNGPGSRSVKEVLRDEFGKPIKNLKEAREVQKKIMAPFIAKSRKGKLLDLKAKIDDAEEKIKAAKEINRLRLCFKDAWSVYLKSQCRNKPGKSTLINYERHFRKFTEWKNKSYPNIKYLEDINHNIASEFANSIIIEGLSKNTFNKRIDFLKALYKVLIKDNYIPARVINPFLEINRFKVLNTNKKDTLSPELVRSLIDNATGELALLFALGYFTGLRRGDCCTLKWDEVDLKRKIIVRIPNKIKDRSDEPKIVKVGINSELYKMLIGIPSKGKCDYVLPDYSDLYWDKDVGRHQITRDIKRHFKKCGIVTQVKIEGQRAITKFGFHSLRYSYITHHTEAGTSLAIIQDNVAHSKPKQTQEYINNLSDKAVVDVANRLSINLKNEKLPLKESVIEMFKNADDDKLQQVLEILKK